MATFLPREILQAVNLKLWEVEGVCQRCERTRSLCRHVVISNTPSGWCQWCVLWSFVRWCVRVPWLNPVDVVLLAAVFSPFSEMVRQESSCLEAGGGGNFLFIYIFPSHLPLRSFRALWFG